MSDTRGVEQDEINMQCILDAVESLGGLTVVTIVINGTAPRMTSTIRNVLVKLRSNLPDVILDTVIVAFTNGKQHEINFDIHCLKLGAGKIHPFYFQNSAFSTDPSRWDERALRYLQLDWKESMEELARMIRVIDECTPKAITAFTDMKNVRNTIKTLFHKARLEVSKIQKLQDEIAALQKSVSDYDSIQNSNKNYIQKKAIDNVEQVPCSHYNTVCSKCTEVCHNKCSLDETTTRGHAIFKGCAAMHNGNCKVCKNKCSYEEHYHARVTFQHVRKDIEDVLHDIKAKYDQAGTKKSDVQKELMTITDAKKVLETALKKMNDEIKQLCLALKKICSGFNLVDELYALINQLKIEAQSLTSIDARKQADDFIRSLAGFCAQLEKDAELQAGSGQIKPIIVDYHPPPKLAHNPYLPNATKTTSSKPSDHAQENFDLTAKNFDLSSIETMLRSLLVSTLTDRKHHGYQNGDDDNNDDFQHKKSRPRKHHTPNRNQRTHYEHKQTNSMYRSKYHHDRTPSGSSDEITDDNSSNSGLDEYNFDNHHFRNFSSNLNTKSAHRSLRHANQRWSNVNSQENSSDLPLPLMQRQKSCKQSELMTSDQLHRIYTTKLIHMLQKQELKGDATGVKLISQELNKRMQGKRTGPLSEEDQDLYLKYIREYERKDQSTLAEDYRMLQQEIDAAVDINIASVPYALLLKCTAIYKVQNESVQVIQRQKSFAVDFTPARDVQSRQQERKRSDSESSLPASPIQRFEPLQPNTTAWETTQGQSRRFVDIDLESMQIACVKKLTALYSHVISESRNETLCKAVNKELEKFRREKKQK